MNLQRKHVILIVIGLMVLLAIGSVGWRYRPYNFHGMVISSAEYAPNFVLTSAHTGERVDLRSFQGKVVLLYFGYTTCPDVCPSTLSDIAKSLDRIGRRADEVQVIWITVDPARDNAEIMRDYVSHFDDSYIALMPEDEAETFEVATQYGIYYEKHDYGSATGYLMDHTSTVTLIDKAGYVRVLYPFGTKSADLAADLRYILSRW